MTHYVTDGDVHTRLAKIELLALAALEVVYQGGNDDDGPASL